MKREPTVELQTLIDQARAPLVKPRAQKRQCVTRTWSVKCAGNPLVEYSVTGTLEPTSCPACGGNALAELISEESA